MSHQTTVLGNAPRASRGAVGTVAVWADQVVACVAHLYGLTEAEFAHVLSTFRLIPDPVKIAAQNAYRDVERGLIR